MGYCCSVRCFNAPHAFQLGWAAPVPGGVLDAASMSPGVWYDFAIPRQVSRGCASRLCAL